MTAGRLGVDVGGTFTDVVLVADGTTRTLKVPSTADPVEGVMIGIRRACEAAGIEPGEVDTLRHGTTVAVNALLEGETADTALVTTEGFADVIEIGRQARPSLYDTVARTPDTLVGRASRYTVEERATVAGIERRVDPAEIREVAAAIADGPAEAVAVSFLHAYAHPENERAASELLGEELGVPVVPSHEVLPTVREYERTATTVADAALAPIVGAYLDRLADRCGEMGLPEPRVMGAAGGIATAAIARNSPVRTVMSGPAAGVVGAGAFAPEELAGVIALDMGGTSTDVSLVRDGTIERTTEATVAGHPVAVPMVDVTSVGAGGGSVAWLDEGGALRVGPRSAGAVPGPACYGRGGEAATLTDAAVELGYVGADATFGADVELDAAAATAVLTDLAGAADLENAVEAARGVLRVATATTTRAVRRVTVERGHDPRNLALAAFGGAGPMIAAGLADRLDIEHVLVPPASGVLSAYGLLAADESRELVRSHRGRLEALDQGEVESTYEATARRARAETSAPAAATVRREADLRYVGQSHELTVPAPASWDADVVRERFEAAHERERGYTLPEDPVELVAIRARATITTDRPRTSHDGAADARIDERTVRFETSRQTPVYRRAGLPSDEPIDGPAVVEGGESTTVCPPGWQFRIDDEGTIHMERDSR